MGASLSSCLYDCEVVHKRLHPKKHEFRYRLFYIDVDLDELPSLSDKTALLGQDRHNLYGICSDDHIDLGKSDIRSNLAAWLDEQGGGLAHGDKVRLLTMPSVLGYIFNPVCFYYIYSPEGKPKYVVVEVCNTFRELKPWLITNRDSKGCFSLRVPKHFYVSPFTSLEAKFDFRVNPPGEALKIHIDDLEGEETVLLSWIHGERKPLTAFRLLWYSFRFPFLGLVVIFRIHWQAMLLWLKRVPYFSKSAGRNSQKDLFRPHSSITNPVKEES